MLLLLLALLTPLYASLAHSTDLLGGHAIEWSVLSEDDAGDVYASLGDHLLLTLHLNFSTGWFGFGIGEPASGSMPGADMLIVEVDGGVADGVDAVTISDRWTDAFAQPVPDDCPDWHLVQAEQVVGNDGRVTTTVVTVRRSLDTGDDQDRVIRRGERERVLYAWGDSATLGYHGADARALTTIDFAGTIEDRLSAIKADPNMTVIDLFNDHVLTAKETDYVWAAHPLYPNVLEAGVKYHIVAVEHLVQEDMRAHVHHFVSHLSNADYSQTMVFHVWAGGVPALVVPDACGFPVSQDVLNTILVQTHYDNSINENVGSTDRSGIRVYLSRELREHDCGVMQLGDPNVRLGGQTLDAGTVRSDFACPGSCVKHDFTIFASFLHMHSFGTRMWTEHVRDGVSLGLLDEVDFWDEDLQSFKQMSLDVHANDELLTSCIHESDGTVRWGQASSEEMCIHFVSYYPFHESLGYCGVEDCGSLTNTTILLDDRPVFGTAHPDHPCGTPVTSMPFPWGEPAGEGEGDQDDGDDDEPGDGAFVDDDSSGNPVAPASMLVFAWGAHHALCSI